MKTWNPIERQRGVKFCAECKAGYDDVEAAQDEGIEPAEAEFKLSGTVWRDDYTERRIPINKLVCENHLDVLLEDRDYAGKAVALSNGECFIYHANGSVDKFARGNR